MDDLKTRLIACFQLTFPNLSLAEIPSVSQACLSDWDSIRAITLATVIEEQFGIEVDIDDLSDLDSFERVRSFLETRIDAS